MAKICLTALVEDGARVFPAGLIGRQVLQLGGDSWLVEFKWPDAYYPLQTKRVYAEVEGKEFEVIYEAASPTS